jgi:hypothetical protein
MKSKEISYATLSRRFRYEIEVPDELVKKVPDDFIKTTIVKGKVRF